MSEEEEIIEEPEEQKEEVVQPSEPVDTFDEDLPEDLFDDYGDSYEEAEHMRIFGEKVPETTTFSSKFSLGQQSLELIGNLDRQISSLTVEIFSKTKDYQKLLRFYSLLAAKWQEIKWIMGRLLHLKINVLKAECIKELELFKTKYNPKVYPTLLTLRDKIDQQSQYRNFKFEVDKFGDHKYKKVRDRIIK